LAEGASLKPLQSCKGKEHAARDGPMIRASAADMARERGAFKVNCVSGRKNAWHG
jgi:hypothetical protein